MKKELSYYETVKAIDEVKKYFEKQLEARLSLTKVQSPLLPYYTIIIQSNRLAIKANSRLQNTLMVPTTTMY